MKKVKPERLEEELESNMGSVLWSWDKATGICSVRIPDSSEDNQVWIEF